MKQHCRHRWMPLATAGIAALLAMAGPSWAHTIQVTGVGQSSAAITHAYGPAKDDALNKAHQLALLWAANNCPAGQYHVVSGPTFGAPLYATTWAGFGTTTCWLDLEVEIQCGPGQDVFQAWQKSSRNLLSSPRQALALGDLPEPNGAGAGTGLLLHGTPGSAFQVWVGPDQQTVAGLAGAGQFSSDGEGEVPLDIPTGLERVLDDASFFIVADQTIRVLGPGAWGLGKSSGAISPPGLGSSLQLGRLPVLQVPLADACPAPDGELIQATISIGAGGLAVSGSAGSVSPGAEVTVTDADGNSTTVTADADGSFFAPFGESDAGINDTLTVTQEADGCGESDGTDVVITGP